MTFTKDELKYGQTKADTYGKKVYVWKDKRRRTQTTFKEPPNGSEYKYFSPRSIKDLGI